LIIAAGRHVEAGEAEEYYKTAALGGFGPVFMMYIFFLSIHAFPLHGIRAFSSSGNMKTIGQTQALADGTGQAPVTTE